MLCSSSLLALSLGTITPPSAPACIDDITARLQGQDFVGVVATAETCGAETGHPRNFYLAGVAYIALGKNARAIVALERYLAADVSEEPERLRDVAHGRLEQARAKAVPVLLRVVPPDDAGVTSVFAERDGERDAAIEVAWAELQMRDGGRVLWLDPGRYRVRVRDGGDRSASQSVVAIAGATSLAIDLSLSAPMTATPPPPPPPRRAPEQVFPGRPWLAATGVAAGASAVAGLSLLAVGYGESKRQLNVSAKECAPVDDLDRCRSNLARAVTLYGAGTGSLGASLGVLAGGLIALMPRRDRRRVAWSVEAGLGGGMVLAGAVLLGVGLHRFNRLNTDASVDALVWEPTFLTRVSAQWSAYPMGAALLGAGLGLGASAGLGLLVQRLARGRTAAALRWQVRPQGLAIAF